ncbi:hypothetical protein MRX96_005026 [Rhipicephalus microplus]
MIAARSGAPYRRGRGAQRSILATTTYRERSVNGERRKKRRQRAPRADCFLLLPGGAAMLRFSYRGAWLSSLRGLLRVFSGAPLRLSARARVCGCLPARICLVPDAG